MDLKEFACSRGHVFRALSDTHSMPCPNAIGHDFIDGEARLCDAVAHYIGPRVDAEAARELAFA